MLHPNLLNQGQAMTNQFAGMSSEEFTYEDFEKTRHILVKIVKQSLTTYDKQFLLACSNLKPDWTIYDFKRIPRFNGSYKTWLN
jgi:hypothetical protein